VHGLSVLEAITSVTRSDITSYLSTLAVYCGDKDVAPDTCDFRWTADNCSSAACLICRQDSGNEDSTDTGLSFSSTPTMVGTPEAWVIPTTTQIPCPMEGFGESEGGGKKTVRWSPYIEELDSSNSSSFELMPIENGSAGKEDRCALLVRDLVLDGAGSRDVDPAVLSYVSPNGDKNDAKPWDGDT